MLNLLKIFYLFFLEHPVYIKRYKLKKSLYFFSAITWSGSTTPVRNIRRLKKSIYKLETRIPRTWQLEHKQHCVNTSVGFQLDSTREIIS